MDGHRVTGGVMMQVRIGADFVQVLLVIDGGRNQFARIRDRASSA